jgi:hypothetical protein
VHEPVPRVQSRALSFKGKASWERVFAERVGYDQCLADQEQEWDLGDVVYRHEYLIA